MTSRHRPYLDPYLAGVGIGLALLAAYVIAGRGLGASGAFASFAASAAALLRGSERAAASPALAPYLTNGPGTILTDWLVWEIAAVCLGAFLSAYFAGRLRKFSVTPSKARLAAAFGGGLLMGLGAKFSRGCTSGQALSGGALLSLGSWVFIAACFAAGYGLAPVVRRLWPREDAA